MRVEHAGDAVGAAQRETPRPGPADERRPGAKGERDQDVRAGAHAAVEVDLGTALDGRDDLGQRVERGERTRQLATAVVRDHDPGRAGIDRAGRVVARS